MKWNINTEVELKITIIGDYWIEFELNKIVEILVEYQYLFPCNMMELRGKKEDIGTIQIRLKSYCKPRK